jgi:threonine 3-dehydrogenase
MRAIVKKERAPGLSWEEVPVPSIGDKDVLIQVKKGSICGTDLHILNWDAWAQKNVPVPLVIGHEFMGVIAKLGKNVKGFQIGQRVAGEGHITCGACVQCLKGNRHLCLHTRGIGYHLPGAFAEYVRLPAENVFALPDTISDDIAAIMDPFGNATHTALTFPLKGEDVLIAGAGPIGMMAAAIARHQGAKNIVVSNTHDWRLGLAKTLGATAIINVTQESLSERTKELGINGYTVGMEMSGSPQALSSLLELMQHGGKVALLGILPPKTAINWDWVIFKMLTIQGIYGRQIFKTWDQMCQMLEEGLQLAPVITHHFPFHEFQKGFDVLTSKRAGKVILEW